MVLFPKCRGQAGGPDDGVRFTLKGALSKLAWAGVFLE